MYYCLLFKNSNKNKSTAPFSNGKNKNDVEIMYGSDENIVMDCGTLWKDYK